MGTKEKEPLSKTEQDKVLKVAQQMGVITVHQHEINAYYVVAFLLDTGSHPSVLAEKVSRDLKVVEENGKLYISWKRPKKKGKEAFTMLPVSKRLQSFIKEFLSGDLPNYRAFYNAVLNEVKKKVEEEDSGEWTKNICPLGMRHTFGVNRIDDGMPETKVQQLMNCSAKTLKIYVKYSKKLLVEVGW